MGKLFKRAFTLLETVLSVTIFIVLMGIVFRVLITSRNIFLRSSAKSDLVSVGRNTLNIMKKELAETNLASFRIGSPSSDLNGNNISNPGCLIIFSVPTDTDSPLDNSVIDSSGSIQMGAVNDASYRIRYRIDTAKNYLLREIITCTGVSGSYSCALAPVADNSRIIATKVCLIDPVSFSYIEPKSLGITLNLSDPNFTSGDVKVGQSVRVKLRN